MNRLEVLNFIQNNQNDKLLDYYNKCYEKLKDLNQQIDKISLYIIIITFIYFIASNTTISSLQLGPFTISDISILVKVIPVLFSFLLLQLVITSSQKSELFTVVKMIFLSIYIQEIQSGELENEKNSNLTRLLLPFSFSTELMKFNNVKPNLFNSCIGGILAIPLLSLMFLPIYFEYYMLKEVWTHYYFQNIGKMSFWLSIWIISYLLYYMVSNAVQSYRERKKEIE